MRKLLAALFILLSPALALAQISNPGTPSTGAPANNDCAKFVVVGGNVRSITTTGAGCATQSNGANPTATATGVAINGAATTFMRSDAAPAVSATTFGGQSVAPAASAAVQGNGALIQLSTGAATSGNCVKFDANGNTVANGAACATQSLGANPTASATGVAVNGVATTFMRSDAAPAVSATTFGGQSVAPGASATVQGNGAKIQLSTGVVTSGNIAKFDVNGNTIDGGAGGSGTVTNLATAGLATGGPITTTGTVTVTAATQADQEAASSLVTVVTPGRQQFHPSAPKMWASFTGSTGAIQQSYNISTLTRNTAGDFTANFTTAFSAATYSCVISAENTNVTTGGIIGRVRTGGRAAGSVRFQFIALDNPTYSILDPDVGFISCSGDQ